MVYSTMTYKINEDLRAPSHVGVDIRPIPFLVAYPTSSKPLLVNIESPWECFELPENAEQDYQVTQNKKSDKWMVSSPSLCYSKYATFLRLWW